MSFTVPKPRYSVLLMLRHPGLSKDHSIVGVLQSSQQDTASQVTWLQLWDLLLLHDLPFLEASIVSQNASCPPNGTTSAFNTSAALLE